MDRDVRARLMGGSQAADLGSAPRDGSQLAGKKLMAAAEIVLGLKEFSKCATRARMLLRRLANEL
jgi:hypothetical protein